MSKTVVCFCPVCRRETLHTIYKLNSWGEKTGYFGLAIHGLLTAGVGLLDISAVAECTDCGHKKKL